MFSTAGENKPNQERPHVTTDPVTGVASITKVPVGSVTVETIDHPSGYDKQTTYISYEGDAKHVDLKLASMGTVTGRVVNYDGQTPVAGAKLSFQGSIVHTDDITTKADGSFAIPAMARRQKLRTPGRATVDGIDRQGY